MKFKWQRELGGNSNSLPYLVFLLSISATICAWVWAGVIVNGTDQERFNYATEEAQQAIQGRIDDQVDLLRATAATFTLQRAWPHAQFHSYVAHLDLANNYNGLQGLGFIQATQPAQVIGLEKNMKADGLSGFSIHPAAQREQFPVVYLEPEDPKGVNAFGFDVYSDPVQRTAMDDARDSAMPMLSGIDSFPRPESESKQQNGFLLFYPVYKGGEVPITVVDRRRELVGFVFAPLRGSGLYQNVLEGEARRYLDVQIFDLVKGGDKKLLYSSFRNRRVRDSAITTEPKVPILGRQWGLRFSTSAVFEQESASWLVRWIFASGILVTILLTAVSYTQVSANRSLSERTSELAKRETQVTQLNENLEELVHDRTTELRASNLELEAFCYSVSHDLRAPLRSVDGFSKSLLEDYGDKFDDQAIDYINRVRNASRRMDELISALLNLSRITRLDIVKQPIDISQVAQDAIDDAMEAHTGVKFSITVEPGLHTEGDPKLIRVVLDNLIGNAIKFSSASASPAIQIGAKDGAFFVRDNGVGFNPAYADKLFVAFERLHNQSEFPGSGIGLATVQRIVQRHGGEVWAESEPGKGATFYFTLR